MKWFKRKNRILDLTKRYERQQARTEEMEQDLQESSGPSENAGGLGFFGAIANTISKNDSSANSGLAPKGVPPDMQDGIFGGNVSSVDEKKRKLAKRLLDMTTKIEDLSNQIYHLQQRIDVLERKSGVRNYD
ncbi:hypothetical protein KAT80_02020 [Candidatus Pacearchaeota archaeon]|nr:hypothetical protein [Candidatus Pacearchaeota archaeon]